MSHVTLMLVITGGLAAVSSFRGPGSGDATVAFEVASVKPNTGGEERAYWRTPPRGTIAITNASLRAIIARAYDIGPAVERFALIGGPDRILSTRFDITAKAPDDAPPGQRQLMLRHLLAERFNLRVHAERRSTPIYAITVARAGTLGESIRRSTHDCIELSAVAGRINTPDLSDRQVCRISYDYGQPGVQSLSSVGPLAQLVGVIQAYADRPVVEATGLIGSFEWALKFSRIERANSQFPSIFTALEEQLGLKLEPRTRLFEVLVIDSVEMLIPD